MPLLNWTGGIHPGFRPVHAKGFMYSGMFTPSPGAVKLTRAPHANRPSTPVTVGFSGRTGVPTGSDTDPMGASPQGIAIRFHLADHVHTDIIGHSINAFPARTGEEFLEFLRAVIASGPNPRGPGGAVPPPIVEFLETHPARRHSPLRRNRSQRAMPGKRTSPSPPSNSSTRPAKAGSADFVSGPKRGRNS